jgi:hypothetical protein
MVNHWASKGVDVVICHNYRRSVCYIATAGDSYGELRLCGQKLWEWGSDRGQRDNKQV